MEPDSIRSTSSKGFGNVRLGWGRNTLKESGRRWEKVSEAEFEFVGTTPKRGLEWMPGAPWLLFGGVESEM